MFPVISRCREITRIIRSSARMPLTQFDVTANSHKRTSVQKIRKDNKRELRSSTV